VIIIIMYVRIILFVLYHVLIKYYYFIQLGRRAVHQR